MIFALAFLLTFTEGILWDENAVDIPEAPIMSADDLKLPFPIVIVPPPKIPPYATCDCVKCLPGKKCVMEKKCFYRKFCPLQASCVSQCPDDEIWMECPTCDDIRDCPPGIHEKKCATGCLVAQCVCPPGLYHHPSTKKCVSLCECPV